MSLHVKGLPTSHTGVRRPPPSSHPSSTQRAPPATLVPGSLLPKPPLVLRAATMPTRGSLGWRHTEYVTRAVSILTATWCKGLVCDCSPHWTGEKIEVQRQCAPSHTSEMAEQDLDSDDMRPALSVYVSVPLPAPWL